MPDVLNPVPAGAALDAPPVTLMLVDDEASVLSALRRLFRTQGYRILQATSGADGLALLQQETVDLVISDMRMPEMDGAQFLERVRSQSPGTVRILLTGYADISATIAAINCGEIHRYIAKPWDDQDLLLVVREALTRRDLEQQNTRLLALTQSQNQALAELNQGLEARVKSRTAEIEQINAMLNKAYEELNQNFMVAVTVFSGLMEMRQDGIAGHSRRVASLARRTAVALKLDERSQQDIYLAALLHDIGKIGFPDKMLGKPVSTYSPDEMTRYRKHPREGEAALMPLAQLQTVGRIVRQHHERLDGNGFPDGLAGDEILIGARIVSAASDYDGMVHGGLAEKCFSPDSALRALANGAGTRYDPRVVAALELALQTPDPSESNDLAVEASDLKPGMVLARDLLSPKGSLLLAAGYVFDARVIRQVRDFVGSEGLKLALRIRKDSLPSAPALTSNGSNGTSPQDKQHA
ncbi:MAG TPA: HD domain-containing phosphohydrolase [Ideonella sp.]|uniref:HD domain-containing phosphohydrolase n=1 Tax=Ideonella sp. TaxID=1929293 RepID=UPI002BC876DF|nr:HD domain-containing phosphohydrolase [Ideonella sp.]HSI49021.1 HD domain-containing phosphohydrolase [Ideonella sp.]